MNMDNTVTQADIVAQVNIGTSVCDRMVKAFYSKKRTPYREKGNHSTEGMYLVINWREGNPGNINFYLKRV